MSALVSRTPGRVFSGDAGRNIFDNIFHVVVTVPAVRTLGEGVFRQARPAAGDVKHEWATKAPLAKIQSSQPVAGRFRCAIAFFSFL